MYNDLPVKHLFHFVETPRCFVALEPRKPAALQVSLGSPHPGGERRIFGLSWDTRFQDTDVSENSGSPKSSILIGVSTINHPFWGTTIFGNTHTPPKMNQWIPTTGIKGTISKNTAIQKPWIFRGYLLVFFLEVDIAWVFLHGGSDQQKHLLYIGYLSSEWNQAYTTLVPNYYSYDIIETVAWIKAPMRKSYFKWRGFSGDSDFLQDLSVKTRCQEKVKKTPGWNFIPWPGIHC